MKTTPEIEALLKKFIAGQCQPEELQDLLQHFKETDSDSPLTGLILKELDNDGIVDLDTQDKISNVVTKTDAHLAEAIRKSGKSGLIGMFIVNSRYIAAAATVLVVLSVGLYFYNREVLTYKHESAAIIGDIEPGGNRATLTLADGRIVDLSGNHEGIIVADDGIRYNNGDSVIGKRQIAVGKEAQGNNGTDVGLTTHDPRLLTLTTPKGGQYQVILPDRSKVWLNASSTLKYPSRFTGDRREVELEGEAYFEVRKSESQESGSGITNIPFIVKTATQQVDVLGTSFNINAYPDEGVVKTTLVEGSVSVGTMDFPSAAKQPIILAPSQQAVFADGKLSARKVDIDNEIAWKKGRFNFQDQSLDEVLRQLARWYDIEVVYDGPVPKVEFYGGAHREARLSTVLRLLESAEIAFDIIDGRKLVISNPKR